MDGARGNPVRAIYQDQEAGLTIRPFMCCLSYSSLEFVGHMVGSDQIAMEENKLDRILEV